jgi:AcrR family transcriptional regulator
LATRDVPAPSEPPPTERGRRTREQLIGAARQVFEEQGYLNARITDIAARAGVAHGTFYTYFDTKEAVLRAVMDAVNASLYESAIVATDVPDPIARLEQSLRQYVRAWSQHAAIMGIILQVSMINPDVRRHRQESADGKFRGRIERGIRRMQEAGLADPAINTQYMASALGVMISGLCFELLALGGPYDEDELVATLTTIWKRSIGLTGSRS